jgi:hypothetical protein
MFQPFLKPSLGMSIQKSSKGSCNEIECKGLLVYSHHFPNNIKIESTEIKIIKYNNQCGRATIMFPKLSSLNFEMG